MSNSTNKLSRDEDLEKVDYYIFNSILLVRTGLSTLNAAELFPSFLHNCFFKQVVLDYLGF
jgi:hypothetical protein